MRLMVPVAMIGIFSIVVTAFAGDRTSQPAGASKDADLGVPERNEPVIRPPASTLSLRAYRRAATSPSSTDRHVAEFLRWKEQFGSQPR
jgi:hypothetical protein